MIEYQISTGRLSINDETIGYGYSGFGDYKNNPDAVDVSNEGPIPPGDYAIGTAYDSPTLGPKVFVLEAVNGTETFGRSLFRIHGDNADHTASHGCIVLAHSIRFAIENSGEKILRVIP